MWRSPRFGAGTSGVSLVFALACCVASAGNAARTTGSVADLCDRAAYQASRDKGVPLDVMQAISRAETGRSGKSGLQPWPWTVNMEGKGRWFATLDEARSYVFSHFKTGARSFDVGCFQINYRWHGEAFRSIDDMFDPLLNAQYAADFLLKLYQEFGNWPDAAGAYHSRTPEYANKYTARFDRIRANLPGEAKLALALVNDGGAAPSKPRNLARVGVPQPLMRGTLALGSLVPVNRQPGATARPFILFE